jgi:hypothetical protein
MSGSKHEANALSDFQERALRLFLELVKARSASAKRDLAMTRLDRDPYHQITVSDLQKYS